MAAPPPPPAGLSEVGTKIWTDLAATLYATSPQLLTQQDLALFGMLIDSLELYAKAQEKIDDEGATKYAGRTGRTYANPAVAIRAAAVGEIIKLSAFFGLTPSHRAAMQAGADKANREAGRHGPECNRRIR